MAQFLSEASGLGEFAEELGIPPDDALLTVLRRGRMAIFVFLFCFMVFLILAARVIAFALRLVDNRNLAARQRSAANNKRKRAASSASVSLPVTQYEVDEGNAPRLGRQGFQPVLSNSGIKVGLTMMPVDGMPARVGAAMVVDAETGTVYIYGGEGEGGASEDLLTYAQKGGDWSWGRPRGSAIPGPLTHACLAVTPSCLVLYGGRGSGGAVNGDVFAMELESGEWCQAKLKEGSDMPGARFGASLVRWHKAWVLFGGVGEASSHFADVWLLREMPGRQRGEVPTFSWEKVELEPNGYRPSPRRAHSAIITANDEMLVLGGYPEREEGAVEGASVEVFDLRAKKWRKETVRGVGPSGGPGGRAFKVGPEAGRIVFLGPQSTGVFNELRVLDAAGGGDYEWLRGEAEWEGDWTMVPGGRKDYSAASDSASDEIFVFGGRDYGGKLQSQLLVMHASDVLIKASAAEIGEQDEDDD